MLTSWIFQYLNTKLVQGSEVCERSTRREGLLQLLYLGPEMKWGKGLTLGLFPYGLQCFAIMSETTSYGSRTFKKNDKDIFL